MSDEEQKRVPLRIRLPFATEAEFTEKYGVHVARGGIFIATRAPKPEGTLLSFEVVLAEGAKLMRGEGVVQKISTDPEPGKTGMLVRFTRIDARTKALIDGIIAAREEVGTAEPPVATSSPAEDAPPPLKVPIAPSGPVALADDVVLGVDLGTTTCRAAIYLNGAPRLVTIPSERGVAMPSVVAIDAGRGEKLLIGGAAKKFRIEHPDKAIIGFKRLMGRRARSRKIRELAPRFPFKVVPDPDGDAGVELGERVYSIPEIAAELLKVLKNAAQDLVGRPLSRAVLCVPAWYSDHQRAAVIEAGRLAGLEVLSILNEPSAVALAFGFGKGLARKRVLVYDLGGGTFDASVVEITGDDLEVVSTGGDAFLGGMDFDQRLSDALIAMLPDGPRGRLLESRVAQERVRDAAEITKIQLSDKDVASVHVPFATTDDAGNPMDLACQVQRSSLEAATVDLVERTAEVTDVVLQAANLTPQHLDEVLLVGGQSRAPAVRARLEKAVGRATRSDVDPQGAVALGAAILGHALVQRERGKRGISLSEVLSAPIGVAVRGGGVRRVLDRNTRLPAEKTLALPVQAGQVVQIAVVQGTGARADDNEYLGALHAVSERQGEMALRFTVTSDGRLTVAATTPTGKSANLSFSTADASDETQAKLLAEAPLPGEEDTQARGLLTGLRRFFGR